MFTVEGVPTEETSKDGKKKRKVFRKLPPNIIKDAKGLIIFTAMRSGIAPFSGAGVSSSLALSTLRLTSYYFHRWRWHNYHKDGRWR